MGALVHFTTNLTQEECCNCSVTFAIPTTMYTRLRQTGGNFYCPNGHSQHYTETENQKLQKQIAQERQRREWAESARDVAQKHESAAKGQLTKVKNRVANGACPCCNRTFQNLHRHMKSKHPDFKKESK